MDKDSLIDELLKVEALAHIDYDEFNTMGIDHLRHLLSTHTGAPVNPAPSHPVTVKPGKPPRGARLHRRPLEHIPRYRAVIHKDGRQYHLGWFMTEQVRSEVVNSARDLLRLGVDVLIVVRALRKS